MATTIITKYGSGAPTASDVVRGELAVDTENKRLYTENIAESVVELGTNPTTLAVDTDTLVVDATNNRVGIGLTSPDTKLHLSDGGTPELRLESTDTSVVSGQSLGDITWESNDVSGGGQGVRAKIHAEAENAGTIYGLAFSTGTGAAPTEKVRITNTGNVGIGTDSPNALTHIYGGASGRTWTPDSADKLALEHSSSVAFDLRTPASEQGLILFSDADARARGILGYAHSSDFMYFNTAGAEAMRIDSSGNVGINENNPQFKLDVENVGGDAIRINAGADFSGLRLTSTAGEWSVRTASDALIFYDVTSASEVGRFDSSGNLGIGSTTADRGKLHVNHIVQSSAGAFSDPHIALSFSSAPTDNDSFAGISYATSDSDNYGWTVGAERTSGGVGDFIFTQHNNSATGSEKVRIDSSGNVGIGTSSPVSPLTTSIGAGSAGSLNNQIAMTHTGASNSYHIKTIRASANDEPAGLAFVENTTERMRIDASGNLLVGTSDAEPYNNNAGNTDDNGIVLSGGGWLASSRFNGVAAYFNRTNTTGDVVTINYNGATKGTIGSDGSILYIGSGEGTDAYLGFGNDIIRPVTSTGASRDAAIDLGYTGMRFKDLYLSGRARAAGSTGFPAFASVTDTDTGMNPDGAGNIQFTTQGTERMRIKSDGDTVFGDGDVTTAIDTSGTVSATSNAWSWSVKQTASSGDIFGSIVNFTGQDPNNTTSLFHAGVSSAGTRYAVYSTGGVANTGNSYGALSDVKLKENIQDASSQWDDLKAVRVRKYSLKEEEASSPTQIGVIAQEVEEAGMGGLVFEAPDIDIDTKEVTGSTKHVKYSILYMKAIKALQEAMDRIETLEAKVAQLEGAN